MLFMYIVGLVEYGSAHKMFNEPRDVRTREYVEAQ